jgi:hypothetical protein
MFLPFLQLRIVFLVSGVRTNEPKPLGQFFYKAQQRSLAFAGGPFYNISVSAEMTELNNN